MNLYYVIACAGVYNKKEEGVNNCNLLTILLHHLNGCGYGVASLRPQVSPLECLLCVCVYIARQTLAPSHPRTFAVAIPSQSCYPDRTVLVPSLDDSHMEN